ncbi:PAS domain-containing sensor histidine kinase [bacterium]|nr:PAS domain-containing sensor histidine kinase [bacterium]
MTSFKKKFFDLKIKVLLIHYIFFGLVIVFLGCSFFDYTSTKAAICSAILFLTLEQIFDNFLFNKKLSVNDDEFLHYKYCTSENICDCQINDLLNIVFSNSPDLITFQDVKLRYTMCSKKFIETFSFCSVQDVIGKTPDELFFHEQGNLIKSYNKLVIKKRQAETYVVRFWEGSSEAIFELVSAPIISNDEVVGILTLSRDITETQNMRESLELFNSKLCALINNSPMLAFIVETDGKFLLGNDRAKEFFLTGKDSTLNSEKIQFCCEDLFSEFMAENSTIINEGKCIQLEKRISAKNGEKYWYQIHKTPIRNKDGKVYAIATFARNIDAEKQIAEQRETYIATLSHDLKTPTIAQIRALELLLSGQLGPFNDEQKEMLKLTLDSCNYMYDMVYTLLSTYKFENGDITLNCSSFDLCKMISESMYEISNIAEENSIKLLFDPQMDSFLVYADRIELKRVIINLLSNAINYAYSSTVVKVTLKKIGKNIEVKVQNSSAYIEPAVMSKLFRKYVTHSEKFNKVGIGLGLYLSKKIIEAHNGKIIAESFKSQNNIFGFSIPYDNKILHSDQRAEFL